MKEITEELALFLQGKMYAELSYFSPIQYEEGKWFISNEEIENCTDLEIKQLLPNL